MLRPRVRLARGGVSGKSIRVGSAGAVATGKGKLLEEVRRVLRSRFYSKRTEESYVGWMRRFILFTGNATR